MDQREIPESERRPCQAKITIKDTHSTLNLFLQLEFAQCFLDGNISIVNNRYETIDIFSQIDNQTMMIHMADRTLGTSHSCSTEKQEKIAITFTRLPTSMSV